MKSPYHSVLSCLAALSAFAAAASALAVPYASAIRNTTGSMYEFVLNEAADSVTITRDGANPVVINSPMAGRHTFDLESFGSYEISVAKSAAPGWATIHGEGNAFNNFTIPAGIAINKDPASPYFGTVYVASSDPLPTAAGRAMGDGIYSLTADMIGVDLAGGFTVPADPNDTALAKLPPSWNVGGSTASPWRMALDAGGNLIVSDWSNANGGIKYATPDLTMGGPLLRFQDGILPLFVNDSDQEVHGSIASKAYVTGTLGTDLVVYAMDEDFDEDGDTLGGSTSFNSIWRWDVGSVVGDFDEPPSLVVSSSALNAQSTWIHDFNGVRAGAHYEPQHDKWYIVQNRFDGNQVGLLVVDPDNIDGTNPTVLFDSLAWSQANNLDGNLAVDGVQDVFLRVGDVTVSPDGTKLLIQRLGAPPTGTLVPGGVMIIPLDANGVPDIQINDNGTPGDTSDDTLANVETIVTIGQNGAHSSGNQLEFDAAGNMYVANSSVTASNIGQLVQVLSPGGSWRAITTSDGLFMLEELVVAQLDGDYNDDGVVNAADYVVFRNNLDQAVTIPNDVTPGMVDASDYAVWVQNFGNTLPGSGGGSAVPEPTATLLSLVALLGLCGRRFRGPAPC